MIMFSFTKPFTTRINCYKCYEEPAGASVTNTEIETVNKVDVRSVHNRKMQQQFSISASFVPLEPIFEQQPLVPTPEEQHLQNEMSITEIDPEILIQMSFGTTTPDPNQMLVILRALDARLQILPAAPTVQAAVGCSRFLIKGAQLASLWEQRVGTQVLRWTGEFGRAANGLSLNKDYNYFHMPVDFNERLDLIGRDAAALVAAIDKLYFAAGALFQYRIGAVNEAERLQLVAVGNEIKESKRALETILKALLQHCFLVYNLPPQVIKVEKNFGISLKLLVAEALMKCCCINRILKIDEKLCLRIVSEREKIWISDPKNAGQALPAAPPMRAKHKEEQPQFKMGERERMRRKKETDLAAGGDGSSSGRTHTRRSSRTKRTRSPSTNEEPDGANGSEWNLDDPCAVKCESVNSRCSLETLSNGLWMLNLRHTRAGNPGGDNLRCDPPYYYLVGECRVAVVGEDTSYMILRAFSLPMLLPVGCDQLERYEFIVFWRNAFGNEKAVSWDVLCAELCRLFRAQTGNAPNNNSFDYLKLKACVRAGNQIARSDLEKSSLPGQNSFWSWLFKVKRLLSLSDSDKILSEMWKKGHIWGFISKDSAAAVLQQYSACNPNIVGFVLIRFSESNLDALSVSAMASGGVPKHLKPWTRDDLKKEGLRRRLADEFPQPDLFELLPTGAPLAQVLGTEDTQPNPVLSGYDEHFDKTFCLPLSAEINSIPGEVLMNFPQSAPSVAPALSIPCSSLPVGAVGGDIPNFGPQSYFPMVRVSPSSIGSIFGGPANPNGCSSAPSPMQAPPFSAQNSTMQFGQTNGASFQHSAPPQPVYPHPQQMSIAKVESMRDFPSNRDEEHLSTQNRGIQFNQGNGLLPNAQTLLKPVDNPHLQPTFQEMSAFPMQRTFISGFPANTTTVNSVPNSSNGTAGFQWTAGTSRYQPNIESPAYRQLLQLQIPNQLF